MSRTFNGTSQYGEIASALITDEPYTIMVRHRGSSLAGDMAMLSIGGGGVDTTHFTHVAVEDGQVEAASNDGGNQGANSTTTMSADTWHRSVGVFSGASARAAFLDGAGKGTNTNFIHLVDLAVTRLAASAGPSTPNILFAGDIYEVAVWSVALSDAEVASLEDPATNPPDSVQSANLVGWWYGDLTTDESGNGNIWTFTGSPGTGDDPADAYSSGSSLGTINDLAATAGDASVALTWTDIAGETSYRVHRSTTTGFTPSGTTAGSGTCIADSLAAGTEGYTDNAANSSSAPSNGTEYFYVVEADDGSTQTLSNEVSATPTAAVPGGTAGTFMGSASSFGRL